MGYLGAFVCRLSLAYVGIVNLLEGNALARDGSTSQTLASSGDGLILIGFSQELRPKLNIAAWMKLGLGAAIAMDVGLHLLPKVPAALGFFSGSLMCRQGHRYVLVMWVEWQSSVGILDIFSILDVDTGTCNYNSRACETLFGGRDGANFWRAMCRLSLLKSNPGSSRVSLAKAFLL